MAIHVLWTTRRAAAHDLRFPTQTSIQPSIYGYAIIAYTQYAPYRADADDSAIRQTHIYYTPFPHPNTLLSYHIYSLMSIDN